MATYFSIFLVILTVGSGLIWLADSLLFAPKRKARLAQIHDLSGEGGSALEPDEVKLPVIVDTAQQIFPVIAFVLVLRSFLYEPFQIPSGSMMPTLLVGDFILVEKFTYGLKDPVLRKKFADVGLPERGDVVVFKYPEDPALDYIKRVVGLPGDTVIYRNKQIYIKPACADADNCAPMMAVKENFSEQSNIVGLSARFLNEYDEQLGDVKHALYKDPGIRGLIKNDRQNQPGTARDEWIVPEGHYFVMGDNRDNSTDSRVWGFVSEENLVGKAVAIWISFEFERSADSWLPGWVPTGVRFSRIGGIE